MREDWDYSTIDAKFHAKEYVEVADEAAKRTRWLTVVLVIASVIVFIGFWNSIQWSWAAERLKAAFDPNYENIFIMTTGGTHTAPDKEAYRKELQHEVVRGYVDNVRFINIPVFGIAIEVNDLGLIGSISFIIVLLLLRFSLSREIKNLNILFREAVLHKELCHFYHKLAMRQVFTVPEMKDQERNRMLSIGSKIVYFLPFLIITFGIGYDFFSSYVLHIYEPPEVSTLLITEFVCLFFVLYLCLRCLERQLHIDEIWEDYWLLIISGTEDKESLNRAKNKRIIGIIEKRITLPTPSRQWWWFWLFLHFRRFFRWMFLISYRKSRAFLQYLDQN